MTTGDVPKFEAVRTHYETDPRFHVDGSLLSYVNGQMVEVNLT